MKIVGLVRCLNEEKNIVQFLDNVFQFQDHVCIVDGGSTDRTGELVNEWRLRNRVSFVIWDDFTEGSISDKVYFTHEARQLNQGLETIRRRFPREEVYVILSDVDEHFCPRVQKHLREELGKGIDSARLWGIHLVNDPDHFAIRSSGALVIGEPTTVKIGRLTPDMRFLGAAHSTHLNETYPNATVLQGATFHYGYMDREEERKKIAIRAVALGWLDDTYQALSNRQNEYEVERAPTELCDPDCETCWISDYFYFLKENSLA